MQSVALAPSSTQTDSSSNASIRVTKTSNASLLDLNSGTTSTPLTGNPNNQISQYLINDALTPGAGNWRFGLGLNHVVYSNHNGNRSALDARLQINSGGTMSGTASFYVGGDTFCFLGDGSGTADVTGNCFGLSAYALANTDSASGAFIAGAEFNTDARTSVAGKVGIQIVDVATSTSTGSLFDDAIRVVNQTGSSKWSYGLHFNDTALKSSGTFIAADSQNAAVGLDFSAVDFSTAAILLKSGAGDGRIQWGTGNEYIMLDGANLLLSYDYGRGGNIVFMNNGGAIAYINSSGQFCRWGGSCTAL
jgi:hypothetical protein